MGDVPIVASAVVKYGQKVCKVVKRNIVNKGTDTSFLTVRVLGISPNSIYLEGRITMTEKQALKFARSLRYNHNRFIKQLNYSGLWHNMNIPDDKRQLSVKFERCICGKIGNQNNFL